MDVRDMIGQSRKLIQQSRRDLAPVTELLRRSGRRLASARAVIAYARSESLRCAESCELDPPMNRPV
jgi:hypothetical protein